MAAAAGSKATATKTRKAEAFPFPLTMAKARGYFPTVDEPFVLKLAAIARAERPAITDAELADCVVKKPSQKSEGLFLSTVGPRAQALNEYVVEQDTIKQRYQQAQAHRLQESREAARRMLADPKLRPEDRDLILRDDPELAAEFAAGGRK
jgi:MoxR-like ATPase